MNLALISRIALFVAILVSVFSRLNVGIVCFALAFIIGVFLGHMKVQEVAAGFPTGMFLTLVGITLLFSQAKVNGTLDKLADMAVKLARGNRGFIPIIFFVVALVTSSVGPGNIGATALLAPVAMAVAGRTGITAFLMAIMVVNGANAGGFSPFAPSGIVANDIMAKIGLAGSEWRNYLNTLIAQSFVAFAGYFVLGGSKMFRRPAAAEPVEVQEQPAPLTSQQKLTVAVILAFVASVVLLKVDITLGSFIAIALLSLLRAADEEEALKAVPWNAIMMVCGVTVLIALMEKAGGMELFTSILARVSTERTVTGVVAFVTGVISVYSSSTGVVLPAFLPTVPGLIEKLGGGDALAIASSINVGAFLVDVSPLSTLGAICIANSPAGENRSLLFNKMLAWGLSMAVVGAGVCFVFFGVL
jgi:Na+/H+ antiporter NhaD/arsenite permease-like protein